MNCNKQLQTDLWRQHDFAFANVSIYKIQCFSNVYKFINTTKPYYIIQIGFDVLWQSQITIYSNKYWISKEFIF